MYKRRQIESFTEGKFIDFTTSGTLNSWSLGTGLPNPFLIDLSDITQGITDQTRIGNKVNVTSIELKFLFWFTGDIDYVVRCIVFKWYDDTIPTVTDILQVNSSAINTLLSSLNHDKQIKRKILLDETSEGATQINSVGITNNPLAFQRLINIEGEYDKIQQIHYQSGTATGVGKFYLLIVGISPSADGYPTQVSSSIWHRTNYTDM